MEGPPLPLGWLTPPPHDGWLGYSAFVLTKHTCLLKLITFSERITFLTQTTLSVWTLSGVDKYCSCADSAAEGWGGGSQEGNTVKRVICRKTTRIHQMQNAWGLFRVRMNFRFLVKSKVGVCLILGYVRKPPILGSEVGECLILGWLRYL